MKPGHPIFHQLDGARVLCHRSREDGGRWFLWLQLDLPDGHILTPSNALIAPLAAQADELHHRHTVIRETT